MKVLNVAEKPSVAKSLAALLGRGQSRRREGRSQYNKVFECDGIQVPSLNGQVTMVITSVSGHLMEMDFADSHRSAQPPRRPQGARPMPTAVLTRLAPDRGAPASPRSCLRPRSAYSFPLGARTRGKSWPKRSKRRPEAATCVRGRVASNRPRIVTLVPTRAVQALVLWLDCDREGENIAFEVVKVVKEAKPSMRVLRATFSAVTPGEVHRALRTLQPPNELKSKAVDARRELDLRVGAAFTRFQVRGPGPRTARCLPPRGDSRACWHVPPVRRCCSATNSSLMTTRSVPLSPCVEPTPLLTALAAQEARVISYGPCQFPTLGFVVARDDFIESFVPEAFWKIVLKDRRPAQPVVDGAGAGAKGGTAKGGKGKDANQSARCHNAPPPHTPHSRQFPSLLPSGDLHVGARAPVRPPGLLRAVRAGGERGAGHGAGVHRAAAVPVPAQAAGHCHDAAAHIAGAQAGA